MFNAMYVARSKKHGKSVMTTMLTPCRRITRTRSTLVRVGSAHPRAGGGASP